MNTIYFEVSFDENYNYGIVKMILILYKILKCDEFTVWLDEQSEKSRIQIEDRLDNIEIYGHFGNCRPIDPHIGLWELKWENGRRIYYYTFDTSRKIMFLIGGKKNDQKKDIRKAKKILEKYRY